MKQIKHVCVDIAGLLRNYGRKKMNGLFTDDNEKPISDKAARQYLAECQAKGWKLLPMSDKCVGFDHFGGGCPGHEVEIETEKTEAP